MANEPEAPGNTDNLDVIRKLLQKLEEAASVDGGSAAGRSQIQDRAPDRLSPSVAAAQSSAKIESGRDLLPPSLPSSLPPGLPSDNAANVKAGDAPYRELGLQERRPVAVVHDELETSPSLPARAKAPLVGMFAFALGAVSAAAVAIYFEPLKRIFPPSVDSAMQMEAASPATERAPELATASEPASTLPQPRSDQRFGQPAPAAFPSPAVQATASSPARAPTVTLAKLLEGQSGRSLPFPLRLDPMPRESDAQLLMLRNVPEWLTLSKGSALGNEIWLMPAHAASDLNYFVAEGTEAAAAIKVELFTMDGRLIARADSLVMASRAAPSQQPGQQYASAPLPSIPEQPTRLAAEAVVRLLARADLLLDTGDLSAARDLFRLAAEQGSAGGAMKLAETYDPGELQRLGMTTGLADAIAARRWYELAQSLGSLQAGDRLTALNQR